MDTITAISLDLIPIIFKGLNNFSRAKTRSLIVVENVSTEAIIISKTKRKTVIIPLTSSFLEKRAYIRRIKTKKKTQDLVCDEIMFNTGRKPNTEMLNLEAVGIKSENGYVLTNPFLQTNVSNIYAIGDVNGKEQFAHTGKVEACIAVNNMFGNKKEVMDYHASPYAIFTYPQIGGVGIDEPTAIEKKIPYDVEYAYFSQNGKAKILYETDGFVKLVFDKKGKLIGARIIGPQAAEIIHEFIVLMNTEGNHREILHKTIHIHPTLSEVNERLG